MQVRGRQPHFGVQLQGQASTWPEYAAAVRGVERLGYGSIWAFDHMLPFVGDDTRASFETLTTLSALALLTERARIGVLVNGVLYRDPVTLAKAAAQVDQMSGGRLDFSLGAGWAEREFRAYGLSFPPLNERYERLEEALQVVELLWSQERSTFEGRYYKLYDAPCNPKPLQAPRPPVMIGGRGLGSLRAAARHADRLNLTGTAAQCARRIEKMKEVCQEAGRDFDEVELSVHPVVCVASTMGKARELAEDTAARNAFNVSAVEDEWLIGTPELVTGRLHEYFDVGINHFVFGVGHPFDLGPLQLLQEEVLAPLQ